MRVTVAAVVAAFMMAAAMPVWAQRQKQEQEPRQAQREQEHFLKDEGYRQRVHDDFLKRREMAAGRSEQLFSVMERRDVTTRQREALEFLYAYMPICDLGEQDGDYYLEQVELAFAARDHFHWGEKVPDELFRHFVVPPRTASEILDGCRKVFFEELRSRVEGLSMGDAALEVNHWCHEKVTYRSTDSRTMSPLALVLTSWGRCGEEAAFTAAAMRAVGIPARVASTPRWVHTDDNHAWVEVWADGQWYYMGACEPEPALNEAWFTQPVRRAMMVTSPVIGHYEGTEEKNDSTPYYSTINLLDIYAPTRRAEVVVVDREGRPVEGAAVKFKAYNYAELYPMFTTVSDRDGVAAVTTGMGDLMVWASKGDAYGYAKSESGERRVTVALDRNPGTAYDEQYTMAPPAEEPPTRFSKETIAHNERRLAYEDSVRTAYMNTFADERFAAELAARTRLDEKQVWRFLRESQGNWREIAAFMERHCGNELLFPFMGALNGKDLRDTPAASLSDHLAGPTVVREGVPRELVASKVLNPRISLEMIRPWRDYFHEEVFPRRPELTTVEGILRHVKEDIVVDNRQHYVACYLTPRSVNELGIADTRSRDVYFVALCRAAGIPAHIEPATGKPQYFDRGEWYDALFASARTEEAPAPKGTLTLTSDPSNMVRPKYRTHFTLGRFQDGDFRTLDLYGNPALRDFPASLKLDTGYYRMMAGSRANDGSVAIHADYFTLAEGASRTENVKMPEVEGKLFVRGTVDMNSVIILDGGRKTTLKKLSNGQGVILCFADPSREPTKHLLQELPGYRAELEQWEGGMLFMIPDDKRSPSFDASQFRGVPEQLAWSTDQGRALLRSVASALQTTFDGDFPFVVYISNNGGILYWSQGYRIGIVESLVTTIRREQAILSGK